MMEEGNFFKIKLFQNIIDCSPNLIFLKDTQGRFITINKQLELMLDCSREEIKGRSVYDFFSPEQAEFFSHHDKSVIESGRPVQFEEVGDFKDGQHIFLTTKFPLFTDSGEVYGLCGISYDITEKRQAEEEMKKSRAILGSALESITDSVSIYDMDSRLIEVNDAFARFYKFRNKEECFRILDEYPDLFDTRFADGTEAPLDMWAGPRARRGEKATNVEYIIKRKDTGEEWIASYSFGPIIGSENDIIGSVVVGRDVTEQKRMEESLRKNSLELSELNAMKDKILSIISHDLKNPFTVLLGYLDMMLNDLDKYSKERIREILILLENSAKSGYAILENLSEWSRVHTGAILFNPELIDLKKIIDDNVSIFNTYAQSKRIKLCSDLRRAKVIVADSHMISTVIRNLIENAIKFTSESGEVVITSDEKDDADTIIIKDTGVGIPADRIGDLFRIDVKYSTHGTSYEKGTGLGLILCKEFVVRHGGSIYVESTEGKGSIFTVILPRIYSNSVR